MKILMINGEVEDGGSMDQTMEIISSFMIDHGVACDYAVLDQMRDYPCIACGKCYRKRRCQQPGINDILEHLDEYDGIVVGLMRCGNDHIAHIPSLPLVTMRKKTESDAWQTLMHLLSYNQSFIVNDEDHYVLCGNQGLLQEEEKCMLHQLMERMLGCMGQDCQPADSFNPVEKLMDYMR